MALFLILYFGESSTIAGCSLIQRGGENALRTHGLQLAEELGKNPKKILDYVKAPPRVKYSLTLASDQDILAWDECTTHAQRTAWWERCQAQGLVQGMVYEDVLVRRTA